MTDRHEAEGHGKVVKCYIRRGRVYGHDLYKPTTPAVAITVEAYNEVREALVTIIADHQLDDGVPFCRTCGAAGGRWPCATNLEARGAIDRLPGVTT